MCGKCPAVTTTATSTAAPECCDDDEDYSVECPEWLAQGYCEGTGTSASDVTAAHNGPHIVNMLGNTDGGGEAAHPISVLSMG